MNIDTLIAELNKRIPSFEEFNELMRKNEMPEVTFSVYEQYEVYKKGKRSSKRKFDFENELLNDLYDYKFVDAIENFSIYYPELGTREYIIFGYFENGMLVAMRKDNREIDIIDEDTFDFISLCSPSVDCFFNVLVELKEIQTNYIYKQELLSTSRLNKLISLNGGGQYSNFFSEITIRYTDFF